MTCAVAKCNPLLQLVLFWFRPRTMRWWPSLWRGGANQQPATSLCINNNLLCLPLASSHLSPPSSQAETVKLRMFGDVCEIALSSRRRETVFDWARASGYRLVGVLASFNGVALFSCCWECFRHTENILPLRLVPQQWLRKVKHADG